LLLGVDVRTLLNWEKAAGRESRSPGRPPHTKRALWQALARVRREIRDQGWTAGWRPIARALRGLVPVALVQRCLSRWKKWRRTRMNALRSRLRHSVEVPYRDALWCQDATQVGRQDGDAVIAEVVRDVGGRRTLGLRVGGAASGDDVVTVLERVRRDRGVLPLVYVTDNGPPYRSRVLAHYLARHHVVHLRSLPRTPQHNPWAERGIGEIKQEAGLESGTPLDSLRMATRRLIAAVQRLDHCRLRPHAAGTNALRDRNLVPAYDAVDRESFYRTTCAAIERAVDGHTGRRARRRAEREAIYASLESFGLVKRIRGDGGTEAVKGERKA
jgi:hypothetical protein